MTHSHSLALTLQKCDQGFTTIKLSYSDQVIPQVTIDNSVSQVRALQKRGQSFIRFNHSIISVPFKNAFKSPLTLQSFKSTPFKNAVNAFQKCGSIVHSRRCPSKTRSSPSIQVWSDHSFVHAPLATKSYWTGPKLRGMEKRKKKSDRKVEQIFRTRA